MLSRFLGTGVGHTHPGCPPVSLTSTNITGGIEEATSNEMASLDKAEHRRDREEVEEESQKDLESDRESEVESGASSEAGSEDGGFVDLEGVEEFVEDPDEDFAFEEEDPIWEFDYGH